MLNPGKTVPVVWLLASNALVVVVLIVLANWWWWERLTQLDDNAQVAVLASTESKATLLDLVNRQLPLHQLLSRSSLHTNRFIDELEHLVLDASRDYRELKALQADIVALTEKVDAAWPPTMDPGLLQDYQANMGVVLDIIYEVLETTSPIQLQLLAEDSEEALVELVALMGRIERQSELLFDSAERNVIAVTESSKSQISELESLLLQIRQQSLGFSVFGSMLILGIQWLLFRMLRHRLAGVARVMRQISESGNLDQRVEHVQQGDLIGDIGLIFNSMLDRLLITRRALQQEKERAESATRAKSDFLANMSHEIRTPVHAITSLIHLMKEQRLTPKLQSYVDKTEVASEALLHVINDVLDFSKVSEGKLELESKRFALQPSLEKLIDVFGGKFNEKGLNLVVSVAPDLPNRVSGDRLRLNQILINLLNNAFKFTSSGAVSLHVACGKRSANRVTLAFSVSDTGIGIEHSRIEKLFDAFAQADATTTRKYGGTGLGLAISKRLGELMGGDIQVISEPNRGSTFTLSATFEVSGQPDETFIPTLPESVHDQGVLLVCTDGAQQQMLEKTLRDWQLRPMTAPSLDQAQSMLAVPPDNSAYKLLVIDAAAMEAASLESWLDDISRHDRLWSLPVIFLSQQGLKAEAAREVHVVDRPVKRSELFNAVASALGLLDLRVETYDSVGQSQKERQRIQTQIAGARILVVEDVVINQQIAQEILNRAGLYVRVADNGQQALSILETERFDLVLMDLQMPIMGGLEATRQIRGRLRLEQLPIVAMTANVIKGVVEECREAGCNDYLSKPLDMDQLWGVLGRWITAAERTPYLADSSPLQQECQELGLPDQLPGVEVAAAVDRVGGNIVLYRTLLQDFQQQYAAADEQLRQLIQTHDAGATQRLAHSLKGVASNLGMMELALAAQAIEHQANGLSEDHGSASAECDLKFNERLEDLHHHLSRVGLSIVQILQTEVESEAVQNPSAADAAAIDYALIKPRLGALAKLIGESNADSLDHFEQLKPHLAWGEVYPYVEQLESHLNCFSFDDAHAALTALQRHLDVQEQELYG